MSTPYERGYRKITDLQTLDKGEPMLFRTGGSMVLLFREKREHVLAADATGCVVESEESRVDAIGQVAMCMGAAERQGVDWKPLLEQKSLPVEVVESEVWVCVDQCS